MKSSILIICIVLLSFGVYGQSNDSISTVNKTIKHRKNNIKIALTPFLLYRPGIIGTYERVVNKNQTLSIIGGYVEAPTLLNITSDRLNIKDNVSKSGYTFGLEYRFYLQKENKYLPPHGVYLGPFLTHYSFQNNRQVTIKNDVGNTDLNLKTNVNISNLGLQVGYQFLLAKRVSIDLIMFGPAFSLYSFNIKLEGTMDDNQRTEEQQAVLDQMADKAPLLGDFFAGKELNKSGRADLFAGGFRYVIQVGVCF